MWTKALRINHHRSGPLFLSMARFRAYTSDSSSSDEEQQRQARPLPSKPSKPTKPTEKQVEQESAGEDDGSSESEASSSESSSLDMNEDDPAVVARAGPVTRKRNALVQDEDGEIRYAHEVEARMDADPTIIPWAQRIGVDAQKMHVMQTSLFRMPEEAAALKALHQDEGPKTSRKRLNLVSPPKRLTKKHGREPDADAFRSDSREVRVYSGFPLRNLTLPLLETFICSRGRTTNVQTISEICQSRQDIIDSQ